MEASEPKLVNPILNIIGIDLLRLGGLQIMDIIKIIKINVAYNI